MKTRIKIIIISATALLFLTSGISFARDKDRRHHKSPKKTERHFKEKKHHSGWSNKHFKQQRKHYWNHHVRQHRRHNFNGSYHHYDGHHRHWKKEHFRHRNHDRYTYKNRRHYRHDYNHHRSATRDKKLYEWASSDSGVVFKVILKDLGFF